jgi:hypothetical protein
MMILLRLSSLLSVPPSHLSLWRQGTPTVHTYNIHSLLHRLGVTAVNHLSVVCGVSCMAHGYGHLQVLGTGGAYNEGGV